jgi:hypothetical protein
LRGVVERAHPTDQTGLASTNQQKTGKKKGWEAASMHSRHEQMSIYTYVHRGMRCAILG